MTTRNDPRYLADLRSVVSAWDTGTRCEVGDSLELLRDLFLIEAGRQENEPTAERYRQHAARLGHMFDVLHGDA